MTHVQDNCPVIFCRFGLLLTGRFLNYTDILAAPVVQEVDPGLYHAELPLP